GSQYPRNLQVSSSDTSAQPHSGSAPAVSLSDITKHFGRFAALRGISADFAPGKLYVILGENGAGKSTLLRIVAGLLEATRGTLTVLGSTNLRDVAMRVGYMGHAPLLYDEMDALENLRYFAGLYGIHDDSICSEALTRVGLDPALKRRVGQYSQGMRQRTSLARAILHDPELLLLDEPFSNVDVPSAGRDARSWEDHLRCHSPGACHGTGLRRICPDYRRTNHRARTGNSA